MGAVEAGYRAVIGKFELQREFFVAFSFVWSHVSSIISLDIEDHMPGNGWP